VHRGFAAIAEADPRRVRRINAVGSVEEISALVWKTVAPLVA
jgi:thymidylate kinase